MNNKDTFDGYRAFKGLVDEDHARRKRSYVRGPANVKILFKQNLDKES